MRCASAVATPRWREDLIRETQRRRPPARHPRHFARFFYRFRYDIRARAECVISSARIKDLRDLTMARSRPQTLVALV